MSKKTIASIEARMASKRLPGKMMMDINGKPVIERVVERLKKAKLIDDVIIATTNNKLDDILFEWANSNKVKCFRGSEEDVLERVVGAHEKMHSEIIIEICGDTPLVDPETIDLAIEIFNKGKYDVVSNTFMSNYPQGIDAQVFSFKALKEISETIFDPQVREHVSLYFYENPEKYNIFHMKAPKIFSRKKQRLQLDYEEDLILIREIYKSLENNNNNAFFNLKDILKLLDEKPYLKKININCIETKLR